MDGEIPTTNPQNMYQVGMCQNELSGTGSIERGWGTGVKTLWDEVHREGLEEATPLMGCLEERPSRQKEQSRPRPE